MMIKNVLQSIRLLSDGKIIFLRCWVACTKRGRCTVVHKELCCGDPGEREAYQRPDERVPDACDYPELTPGLRQ